MGHRQDEVRIDVWSDVVCPWCYIGKRRLERAMAQTGRVAGRDVEIVHHAFQLDPAAPVEYPESMAEHLGAKYGGGAEAGRRMMARVSDLAAEEGLAFQLEQVRTGTTRPAHRVLQLALAEHGPLVQAALVGRLFEAYFVQGRLISDPAVLRTEAVAAGVDGERVDAVLASNAFDDAVEADLAQAAAIGISGVPFFVVDRKYGISGAQPTELFVEVLDTVTRERADAPS